MEDSLNNTAGMTQRSGSDCLNSLAEFYKWISAFLSGNRDWLRRVEVNLIRGLSVKR